LNELALFAGAGGGILGGDLLGWRTICAVEIEPSAAGVLVARQNDRTLPPFPIWDDVRTFDGRPWRGAVDVVSGGFPCQDISIAGGGDGLDGERSGLWVEMARIIREVRPRFAFVENSSMLASRGLDRVLGDLAELGFDARWGVFTACAIGAPHARERMFIVADAMRQGLPRRPSHGARTSAPPGVQARHPSQRGRRWPAEPAVGRVANGLAGRVDRIRALGNGQVPGVAAMAWRTLTADHPSCEQE
jgi:DNA (cytosine-5)-methyltransferase 1